MSRPWDRYRMLLILAILIFKGYTIISTISSTAMFANTNTMTSTIILILIQ